MPPVKSEPVVHSPEIKSPNIESAPHIETETFRHLADVKSETVDYTPEIPQTKRLKTLSSHSPSTSAKGKSKILKEEEEEDDDDDSLSQQQLDTCGVCLLEEGVSIRGFIDSCEHYFCFVCIMEWAKVESRCPICKRRFSTIRRPPKTGVFFSERIVNVPERNQVYYYNGNATLGPSDPYSEVKCSVCSSSSDDNLLLLCDLCDSAAHSYCVGLGATVPEGDWFCKDCTLSRDEHAKVETDTPSGNNDYYDNNTLFSSSNTIHVTRSDVSIHDIIRASNTHEPDTSCIATSVNQSESVAAQQSSTQSTVDMSNAPNARTLQRCVNVHARIQVLRENWDGFRGGSLNFSSLNQESTSQKNPYDTDKAWKMMDIAAKALRNKSGNKSSVDKVPQISIKKERLLKEASKVRPRNNYFGGSKKHSSAGTCINNVDHHRFQMLDKRKHMHGTMMNNQNHVERELPSSRKIIASAQVNNHHNCQNLLRKDCLGAASGSSGQSSSIATDKGSAVKEIDGICEKKKDIKKDAQSDGLTRELENAKSEIQSLVKLNLKLLSRDKKLEVHVFKEVARHATHSIMATCGIEPPKARYRSFERLVCNHSETHKRLSSTLMSTSCRECFFSFVKEVVTSIASDTTSSCKV